MSSQRLQHFPGIGQDYTSDSFESNLALRAGVFNVTNQQRTTAVEQTYNTVATSPHQNYPYFKMPTTHQQARPGAPSPGRVHFVMELH